MPNTDDMSKPINHGELREALAANNKLLLAEVAQIVANAAKRSEESLRAFVAREVAHMVKSSEESVRSYMGVLLDKASANDAVIDAKYSDLPPRVTRLEAAVFPPKRQRRR